MPDPPPPTTVHLRPRDPVALSDERVRAIVRSTAAAIAERTGVNLRTVRVEPEGVVAVLDADRLAAIGFAAELRRLTERWHEHRTGGDSLWGRPDHLTPDDPFEDLPLDDGDPIDDERDDADERPDDPD
jgi:hypothetical protein